MSTAFLSASWVNARWVRQRLCVHPRLQRRLTALVFLRGLQVPALAWSLGEMLARAGASARRSEVPFWIGTFVALAVTTFLVFVWRIRAAEELGEAVALDLRRALIGHSLERRIEDVERDGAGRLTSYLSNDVDNVRALVREVLPYLSLELSTVLVSGVIIAWKRPSLGIAFCVAAGLITAVSVRLTRRAQAPHLRSHQALAQVGARFAEAEEGRAVLRAHPASDPLLPRLRTALDEHATATIDAAERGAMTAPTTILLGQSALVGLLLLCAFRRESGSPAFDDALHCVILAGNAFASLPGLAGTYLRISGLLASAGRLRLLLDTETEPERPGVAPSSEAPAIVLDGVAFAYRGDRHVLRDISNIIAPGKTTAVIGRPGSGKSTLLALLAGFHEPSEGSIRTSGSDVDLRALWASPGWGAWVPQDPVLFSGTVLDNVRLATTSVGLHDVRRAAERLGVLDLIEALPRGFATDVGPRAENLSAGQRQIVSLLRATLVDPRLLLLDEPTAQLDHASTRRINAAITQLSRDRTTVIVTHQLAHVPTTADIIVLEAGRLVEHGLASALIARDGVFSRLRRGAESIDLEDRA